MKLDDLRFNDRDVKKILKSAVRREKKRCSEINKRERFRFSTINTDYDSAATYQDLIKVAEERGLNPDVVRDIVENQNYNNKLIIKKLKRIPMYHQQKFQHHFAEFS